MITSLNAYAAKIESKFVAPGRQAALNSQFEAVIVSYRKLVARMRVSDSVKSKMLARLNRTHFRPADCSDKSLFTPNAYYDRASGDLFIVPQWQFKTIIRSQLSP